MGGNVAVARLAGRAVDRRQAGHERVRMSVVAPLETGQPERAMPLVVPACEAAAPRQRGYRDRTAQRPGGVECLLVGATYGVARGCVGLEPSAGAAVGGPPRITRGAHLHMSVEHGLAETHR